MCPFIICRTGIGCQAVAGIVDYIDLSNNFKLGVNATVPASWSALTSLTFLKVTGALNVFVDNVFGGSFPPQWSSLTNLQHLELGGELFTGALPAEWSALTKLTSFEVGNTKVAGTLPASWAEWKNVKIVQIVNSPNIQVSVHVGATITGGDVLAWQH